MSGTRRVLPIGVVLCVAVLSMWVADIVRAEHSPASSDVMKTDSVTNDQKYNFQSDDDKQQNVKEKGSSASGEKSIQGELFRIEDANYFVKTKDGAEVRLHTDKTTDMKGTIKKGAQIKAMMNDKNHASSIQAVK